MSNTLIRDWQDGAIVAECNFCAIEVGEAAGSDIELPELLHAHVPQDAHLYLVQRDAKVSIEEVEQVREVLDRLEIPLASDEPLNADDVRTWVFPVLDEVAPPEHVRAPDYEVAAVRQKLEQNRVKSFELNREIEQLQAFIVAMRETGASPGEENEAPTVIMSAFNELQFSKHWQSVAGTPGAKAVYQLMGQIYYLNEETQSHVEGLLHTLFLGMRDDPDTLRSVLRAAEKVTTGMTSMFALSKMCIAYMEHRVASGALDDKPLVALDFARCVQRYKLLEDAYANQLKAMRDSQQHNSLLEVDLSMAFEDALIAVLRDGGKRGLPPRQQGMTPGEAMAADTVQVAWQEMLKLGNEGFQNYLDQWIPWQGLVDRRRMKLAGARESQQAMN
ncbi:hypothetical protein [Variovorax sp. RA8]|uniref:hypothetical protein n=1 Tax=Variovorax sp. (strain JCM 16519 / RA8) TaxID=662548 RepID=UPI0013A58B2D|nr:hypothetical protein [Variovorax sp. RA8]